MHLFQKFLFHVHVPRKRTKLCVQRCGDGSTPSSQHQRTFAEKKKSLFVPVSIEDFSYLYLQFKMHLQTNLYLLIIVILFIIFFFIRGQTPVYKSALPTVHKEKKHKSILELLTTYIIPTQRTLFVYYSSLCSVCSCAITNP